MFEKHIILHISFAFFSLPEIPSDTAENNPLLRSGNIPPFSELTTEKCVSAIGKLVIEYESGIHHMDQKLYGIYIYNKITNIYFGYIYFVIDLLNKKHIYNKYIK